MTVLLYILTGQWWLDYFQPASVEGAEGKDLYYIDEEADDLETPLVNGTGTHPTADGRHHMPLPPAAAAQEAIPIGSVRRGGSYGAATGGTPIGSYGRGQGARGGTPYERGSFTMYINTFGSHTSPHGRGLLSSQPVSEEPEH